MNDDIQSKSEGASPVTCGNCRHYYITWDRSFPYGCKAMGFKCRVSPAQEVREASGVDCRLFLRRESRRD